MKKILIGVCGLGNGHTTRQKHIINMLAARGHHIMLFVPEENKRYLDEIFPDLKKITVKIPWVYSDENGIDFVRTYDRYVKDDFDWYKLMLSSFVELQKEFNGKPDVVITDYEPNSAQLSYAMGVPLICLEQQSKFLGYIFNKVGRFSPIEEISRLNYFSPKADRRYVSSFFPLDKSGEHNVEYIPPILSKTVSTRVNKKKVIVYFSPYGEDKQNFSNTLSVLRQIKEYNFHVYSNEKFNDFIEYRNLVFNKIGNRFANNFNSSSFVISTAGHQLISESINFDKPVLLLPFDTFEQNYNTAMVCKYHLGQRFEPISVPTVIRFIDNLNYFRSNIIKFKKTYWKNQWDDILMDKLKKDFGL